MNSAKDIEETIRILENYPRLKGLITIGHEIVPLLSRSTIKSLTKDEFLALCSLPLDLAVPGSVREFFISRAKEYGKKILCDLETKTMKVKEIIKIRYTQDMTETVII